MKSNQLVIVGSGIKCLSHLTTESISCIRNSSKVLYLLNDPLMEEWIKNNNSDSESLEAIYTSHYYRIDAYKEITQYILLTLQNSSRLAVVYDGHPVVYAQSTINAAREAKKLGFRAKILPGISADSCLYADLHIDPGEFGCHSYEATDFLIKKRSVDVTSHLILWQIGSVGNVTFSMQNTAAALEALMQKLLTYYPPDHYAIIYEAAQYEGFDPRVERFPLTALRDINLTSFSILYVPPATPAKLNYDLIEKLNIPQQK